MAGYGNLHRDYGWRLGVHRGPAGYEHPWLVVCGDFVIGVWSRQEARECWNYMPSRPEEWEFRAN